MLDVTDRLVVLVGGGAVAVRKAKGLQQAGGRRIRVVAPQFHPDLPEGLERVVAAYTPQSLTGAGLVFALTDQPAVNDAVVLDARGLGVLVGRADSEGLLPGDFISPASAGVGELTITVSAGSAALTAFVRDRLVERIDPLWVEMAEIMNSLRPRIVRTVSSTPAQRADVFRALASDEAMDALRQGGREGLFAWLLRRYPELKLSDHG